MSRTVERRLEHCAVCGVGLDLCTLDSPHPEAPTLFQTAHPDAYAPWFGFVEGGKLVVVCSETCAQALLKG